MGDYCGGPIVLNALYETQLITADWRIELKTLRFRGVHQMVDVMADVNLLVLEDEGIAYLAVVHQLHG